MTQEIDMARASEDDRLFMFHLGMARAIAVILGGDALDMVHAKDLEDRVFMIEKAIKEEVVANDK